MLLLAPPSVPRSAACTYHTRPPQKRTSRQKTPYARRTSPVRRQYAAAGDRSSRSNPRRPQHLHSRTPAAGANSPDRPTFRLANSQSALSSSPVCPAPPDSTRTSKPLPCSFLAGHIGRFYLGPTPSLQRLKHLATKPGTGHHAGGYRPSRFSFGLCLTAHVGQRCYPRSRAVCAAFRHAILAPRPSPRAFSLRTQKLGLPYPPPGCPGGGRDGYFPVRLPVFRQTHSEALSGLYSLSSFPPCFQGRRSVVVAPIPCVAAWQVPSRDALHRPEGFRPRTRDLHPL